MDRKTFFAYFPGYLKYIIAKNHRDFEHLRVNRIIASSKKKLKVEEFSSLNHLDLRSLKQIPCPSFMIYVSFISGKQRRPRTGTGLECPVKRLKSAVTVGPPTRQLDTAYGTVICVQSSLFVF